MQFGYDFAQPRRFAGPDGWIMLIGFAATSRIAW